MSGEVVLVTGGTGFIATHCIVQLLHAGYRVRTTVRSLDRAGEVREMVRRGEADPDRIEFLVADLGRDDGWTRGRRRRDVRAARGIPVPHPPAEGRERAHRAGSRRRGAGAARGTCRRRAPSRADLVVRGDRLPCRSRTSVRRAGLDRPLVAAPHAVHQVEDHRRARRLGLRRPRGRRPRAGSGQPGAGLRSGPRPVALDVDRGPARPAQRQRPGGSAGHHHRGRRARCRRPARAGDDASGCRGRALHRGRGRPDHVPRPRHAAARAARHRREARADARAAPLARTGRRAREPRPARDPPADAARTGRLAREGRADAGLGTCARPRTRSSPRPRASCGSGS